MSKIDLIDDVMKEVDRIEEDFQGFQKHIVERERNFNQEGYITYLIAIGYLFSKSDEEQKLVKSDCISDKDKENLENILRKVRYSIAEEKAKEKLSKANQYKEIKVGFLEYLVEKARRGKF